MLTPVTRHSGRILAALLLLFLCAIGAAAPTAEQIQATYRDLVKRVSFDRIKADYTRIAGLGSRLSGTEGERNAMAAAETELKALGAKTSRQPFTVTVPDPTSKASLGWVVRSGDTNPSDVDGSVPITWANITLYPIWPNLVRTSTVDAKGPLVYAGRGGYEDLKGKTIKGAIVVMEFDSAARWRNVTKLGAKAIVFIEPGQPNRSEAEAKFAAVPLSAPRFFLPLKDAAPVLAAAKRGQVVTLKCRQDWVAKPVDILTAEFPGSDTGATKEPVALFTYTDSASVVPGLAPGAESIGGMATALETARIYAKIPHRRPLRIVMAPGHLQGLQGSREWVEGFQEKGGAPFLTLALDITSGSPTIGSYCQGWFYEFRNEVRWAVDDVSRAFRTHADDLAKVMGVSPARLVLIDATNDGDNRTWKNNIPGKFALDSEPMGTAGLNALTFTTVEDGRPRTDTPFDTLDKIDFGNVRRQVQTVVCMVHHALNDTSDRGEVSSYKIQTEGQGPFRMSLIGGFATLDGQVVSFDPTRSFVPDTPVVGSLAAQLGRQKTLMGVRGDLIQITQGKEARYKFVGAAPINSYGGAEPPWIRLNAFHLDAKTGNVDYAASLGVYGEEQYPIDFPLKVVDRTSPIVVFPCRSVDLYDLIDPQELKAIPRMRVLDARTGTNPQDYGLFSPGFDQRLSPDIEDAQVLFMPAGKRFILLGGLGENRLILTDSSVGEEEGKGYLAPGVDPGKAGAEDAKPVKDGDRSKIAVDGLFPKTALNAALDIIAINQTRLDRFQKYRIISGGVSDLQKQAVDEVKLAEASYAAQDWGEADRHARAAWGYALRAHPVIQTTANDVVNGVVFYLFLLIPFSYFLERLTFGHQLLTKQLMTGVMYFIGSFILLRFIHPAFEIVQNPTMIFVAFVMGVLSLVVISFLMGKFESSLRAVKAQQVGVHEIDIRRGSVAMAAFNLGVSNMRRRKARTILTTLTLVVMTFIVLSFTSVVSDLSLNEQPSPNPAAYSGILVRTPALDPLQLTTFRTVQNEFAGRGTVVRRAYYYGADIGDNAILTLQRADRVADARAMMGLEPGETDVVKPQQALVPGGRWFKPGDRNVMILPQPMAEQLKVEPGDVGKATVDYAGTQYTVIGIIDPSILRALTDLDGDGILPPDFSLSRRYQQETASTNQAFRQYLRLDPGSVFIVPAETALSLGADMRSVAVRFEDPGETRKALDSLMPRLRLNLYASVPNNGGNGLEVRQFSVFQSSKSSGLGLILVQLLIAAVFVLNTMVATVYERTKEIAIFSSIGLAPNHIAMLFFAESLVYGVLGAVIGYYAAQGVAKIIVTTGALPGLILNFSSTSAVMSAVLVMAVVLLSTIYPARKASQIAAPAMNEDVFQSEPDGDTWRIPLPFSISENEAAPLTAFLGEWLKAYEGYTIGDFVTKGAQVGLAGP
ncbi:FtsX-like permease family protein, partial [bacterium]